MYMKSALATILTALILSGCAGSRDRVVMTEPAVPATTTLGPEDWLVAADAAREHVPGSSTFVGTSDELSMLDESIFSNADTLLYGGFYYTGAEFPGHVLLTDCVEGGVCKYGRTGETSPEGATHDVVYAPVMEHKGIRLAQARWRFGERDNPFDLTGYGGWMHYNSFAIQVDFFPDIGEPDSIRVSNYSVGSASGANPVSGTGTWTGVAMGIDLNQLLSKPGMLQGDAEITYDFDDQSVDVMLDNFANLATGAALDRTMEWSDIAAQDGLFSHGGQFDGEYVQGAFYGSYHEEVGGVFKSGSIAGSFGAPRSDRQ